MTKYYHDNEMWFVHSLPLCRFLIANGFEYIKVTQDPEYIDRKCGMFKNSQELQDAMKVYQIEKAHRTTPKGGNE